MENIAFAPSTLTSSQKNAFLKNALSFARPH